jgi:hypothetical protein
VDDALRLDSGREAICRMLVSSVPERDSSGVPHTNVGFLLPFRMAMQNFA